VTRLHLDVGADAADVRAARHRATEHLVETLNGLLEAPPAEVAEDLLDDVALVVSELVGNAVRHGTPPVSLDLEAGMDGRRWVVEVRVHDHGRWDPTRPATDGGRGLAIVRALAAELVVRHGHGTDVRARLERPVLT
jgi:anti-sigma regulatory factor (Ser/Thr protein kinase)